MAAEETSSAAVCQVHRCQEAALEVEHWRAKWQHEEGTLAQHAAGELEACRSRHALLARAEMQSDNLTAEAGELQNTQPPNT